MLLSAISHIDISFCLELHLVVVEATTPVTGDSQPLPKTPSNTIAPVAPVSQTTYAGFGRRLGAVLLDGLILGAVMTVVFMIFGMIFFAVAGGAAGMVKGSSDAVGTAVGGTIVLLSLVEYALALAIALGYQVYFVGKSGQTLGKKALGIKVVGMKTMAPVGFGGAILREVLGKFVSGIIPFAIGYLWMLWDKDKQTLHDKIAGTIVIKV